MIFGNSSDTLTLPVGMKYIGLKFCLKNIKKDTIANISSNGITIIECPFEALEGYFFPFKYDATKIASLSLTIHNDKGNENGHITLYGMFE